VHGYASVHSRASESMEALGGFANLPAEHLAALTYASLPTVRRWKRRGRAPRLVVEFLKMLESGPLGMASRAWDGWIIRRDKLVSPDGWEFEPGEVKSIPLRRQQLSEYERQERLRALRDQEQRQRHPQPEIQPPRREPSRRRGDLFDHLSAVSRDHDSAPLAKTAVFAPRRQPTPTLSHVSCPSCASPLVLAALPELAPLPRARAVRAVGADARYVDPVS
jgi:Phage protein